MLYEYNYNDIYIRHAVDECPNVEHFTMHLHERCEIYFFVSGNVEYLVEGSRYPLEEDNLLIMRPAESHMPRLIDQSRYERFAINFPISFAASVDPKGKLIRAFTERPLGRNNLFSSSELNMTYVGRLFREMCQEEDTYDRGLTLTTHLLILLDMIERAYSVKGATEASPLSTSERLVRYVNKHLFEELSVPMLAKHFYLSPSQFGRCFRKATGASPWEYITRKRLAAAKEKIRSGHSAQSACESCGFGDYSSFYRAYTKHFGCAPTDDQSRRDVP